MSIEHVLAVVPVTDVQRSRTWYETLFGRAADNNPMPNLVEWQVVPGGWVQVFADDQHALPAGGALAVDMDGFAQAGLSAAILSTLLASR